MEMEMERRKSQQNTNGWTIYKDITCCTDYLYFSIEDVRNGVFAALEGEKIIIIDTISLSDEGKFEFNFDEIR